MLTRKSRTIRQRGSVAELPLVMLTLFLMIAFPMINLGTTALRFVLFLHCCKQAATVAASAYSFSVGSAAKPAAVVSGPAKVNNSVAHFPGITVQSTTVNVVSVQMDNGVITKYPSKLSAPADTGKNLYFVELTSTALIEPMTTVKLPCFMNVPGLSSNWTSKVSLREFVESPQGLDD